MTNTKLYLVLLVMFPVMVFGAPDEPSTKDKEDLSKYIGVQAACINGQYYDEVGLDLAFERQKKLDLLSEECPLSPSRAAQLALQKMKAAFAVPKDMKLSSIDLFVHKRKNAEVWAYNVSFGDPDNDKSDLPNFAVVVVLLDGTVGEFKKNGAPLNVSVLKKDSSGDGKH